jgi:hypothetical protein
MVSHETDISYFHRSDYTDISVSCQEAIFGGVWELRPSRSRALNYLQYQNICAKITRKPLHY